MTELEAIIKPMVDRIRVLERIQEGNGFVPYFFVPQWTNGGSLTLSGYHSITLLGVNDFAYLEIIMPRKTENLEIAQLIYIPEGGSGSWNGIIYTGGGQCEEDRSSNTDTLTFSLEPTVEHRIQCLDMLGALEGYTVGDIVGVSVRCTALVTSTGIGIIGIRLR